MEDYFNDVVSSLNIDDMFVLGVLLSNEATSGYKAITTREIIQKAELTEATYRRTVYRLMANKFVEVIPFKKQNAMYITQYGLAALMKSTEGVGV